MADSFEDLVNQKLSEASGQNQLDLQPGEVPLKNVLGQLEAFPQDKVQDAVAQGYDQPTEEDIQNHLLQKQYGTPTQQAITGAEALGRGVLGPVAPLAEQALGVSPEGILARQKANPLTDLAGEGLGVAASLGTGFGEAALASKIAAPVADVIKAEGTVAKIGSAAVKNAIETSIIGGSDEVSKMVLNDPSTSAETALVNVGLSGLIGGAIGGGLGAISPLWHSVNAGKLGDMLGSLQKKLGGVEGAIPDSIQDSISQSGMDIAPEVKAALSDDPAARQMFQTLQESTTGSGIKAQQALSDFKRSAGDAMISALGKSPEDVANLGDLSASEAGNDIKKSIVNTINDTIKPITDQFEAIKESYKGEMIPQALKNEMADKIGQLSASEGYNLSPSSSHFNLIQNTLKELQNINTLEDLRKYQSIISDKTYGNLELRRIGGQLKGIMRNTEDNLVESSGAFGDKVPDIAPVREAYKGAMDVIDKLNDRLNVGRYNGPSSFINALKEMSPEDVVKRLNPKGDSELITHLTQNFPEAANSIRDYNLSSLLKNASDKASPGESINTKALLNGIDKLSPEMKEFVLPQESAQKVEAIRNLLEALPAKLNSSGTAKTLDALWSKIPASATGMAAAITGHNPIVGATLGYLGKLVSRDAPDAIKLSTLKFLGSDAPLSAAGFKSMVDYTHAVIKGDSVVSKAVKNVFKAESEVLPEHAIPSDKDRLKLDKIVTGMYKNEDPMYQIGGNISHYLPQHGTALAQTAANATTTLQQLRPSTQPSSPLDSKIIPNTVAKSAYNNALDLAQQPLLILDKLKKGTITQQDVQLVRQFYPAMYNKLSNNLIQEAIEHKSKGNEIPYRTRLGLSLFTGQPLDSTMTPASIMAAQPMVNQQQPAQNTTGPHSTKNLGQVAQLAQTPGQAAAARNAKRNK